MTDTNLVSDARLRVAFVVQRYGPEVVGGAESLCREVAERLSPYIDVHILTSCAQDYQRWTNTYPPGVSEYNDVTIHRFPVSRERRPRRFQRLSQRIYRNPRRAYPAYEVDWLLQQGPETTDLLDHIRLEGANYDSFIFFTYLYYTTVWGLPLVAEKSALVPTAHDETPIHLDVYRSTFHVPRHLIFLSEEERDFVHQHFDNRHIPWSVIGSGMELPAEAEGARFRQRYQVDGAFALYVGRITPSKSCDEMFDHYLRYKAETGSDLKLILVGKQEMPIPEHKDIIYVGFVSDSMKYDAFRAATVFLMPSRFESLSLVSLESMAVGTPLLANACSDVLRGHCIRSNGGLYYGNHQEFSVALSVLLESSELRGTLGENGMRYVRDHYRWTTVERQYLSVLERIAQLPRQRSVDPGCENERHR